jgi:3-methyladenine DNA glycosylase AlkD
VAADRKLIKTVREALKAAAEPKRAPGMQAYMKSAMPYRGVMAGPLRQITKAAFNERPLASFEDWRDTALALWRDAQFREERYAAQDLVGFGKYKAFQSPACLPMYEEFIVDGAWWDHVDDVAIHRIGPLLVHYRDEIEPIVRAWSTDDDLWRRRSSIICQVGAKGDIDLALLYDCIEANMADTAFFIRKAIGWALRSHAWLNPGEVERYVRANEDRLSGLSKREARKNIGKTRRASK